MKIDPRKPAPQPPADQAKAARQSAKQAVQAAAKLGKQAETPLLPKLAPERAVADNTRNSVGLERMRAIKRGGTGPLPWEQTAVVAPAAAPAAPDPPRPLESSLPSTRSWRHVAKAASNSGWLAGGAASAGVNSRGFDEQA